MHIFPLRNYVGRDGWLRSGCESSLATHIITASGFPTSSSDRKMDLIRTQRSFWMVIYPLRVSFLKRILRVPIIIIIRII